MMKIVNNPKRRFLRVLGLLCLAFFLFFSASLLVYSGWFFYSTGTSLKAAESVKPLQTRQEVDAALHGWTPRRLNVAGSDFARSRWSQLFEEKEPGYAALRYTLKADICVDVYYDRSGRKIWVQSND